MGLGLSLITGVLKYPELRHGALFAVGALSPRHGGRCSRQLLDRPRGRRSAWRCSPRHRIRRPSAAFTPPGTTTAPLHLRPFADPGRGHHPRLGAVGISHLPPEILRGAWTSVHLLSEVPPVRDGRGGLLVFLTWLFLEKTRYGAIMRAGHREQGDGVAAGIDIHLLFTVASRWGPTLRASRAR